jgi:hypothetical protein
LFALLLCGASLPVDAARTTPRHAFLEKVRALCGQRFEGVTEFTSTANDSFRGARLVMSVDTCAENEIRIAFDVGEDRSRTWILTRHGDRLLFKHDHRKPDGSPDEITMYGGWAAEGASATVVRFPADGETAKLIPAAATNVWTLEIDEGAKRFVYYLERDGKPRYRAVFDLSKPVPRVPQPAPHEGA